MQRLLTARPTWWKKKIEATSYFEMIEKHFVAEAEATDNDDSIIRNVYASVSLKNISSTNKRNSSLIITETIDQWCTNMIG